ncbi:MAG TPA: hypothetical protein VFB27_12415 [Opitutaceae bacterium]|nr:hypothetical protein [Opitutaceae bacterium]
MTEQLDLPVKCPAPVIDPAEVELVVSILRASPGWLTAKQIAESLGNGSSDRRVRAIASASAPRIVSYPGSPGYKLFELCTVEEINHCVEAFRSQCSDMFKRSTLYAQAYHRRFRGTTSNGF